MKTSNIYELKLRITFEEEDDVLLKPAKKLFMLQIWFRIRGFQYAVEDENQDESLTRSPNKENNMILLFVIIILLASSFCFANK